MHLVCKPNATSHRADNGNRWPNTDNGSDQRIVAPHCLVINNGWMPTSWLLNGNYKINLSQFHLLVIHVCQYRGSSSQLCAITCPQEEEQKLPYTGTFSNLRQQFMGISESRHLFQIIGLQFIKVS